MHQGGSLGRTLAVFLTPLASLTAFDANASIVIDSFDAGAFATPYNANETYLGSEVMGGVRRITASIQTSASGNTRVEVSGGSPGYFEVDGFQPGGDSLSTGSSLVSLQYGSYVGGSAYEANLDLSSGYDVLAIAFDYVDRYVPAQGTQWPNDGTWSVRFQVKSGGGDLYSYIGGPDANFQQDWAWIQTAAGGYVHLIPIADLWGSTTLPFDASDVDGLYVSLSNDTGYGAAFSISELRFSSLAEEQALSGGSASVPLPGGIPLFAVGMMLLAGRRRAYSAASA